MNYPTDACLMALAAAVEGLAKGLCNSGRLKEAQLDEYWSREHARLLTENNSMAATAFRALIVPIQNSIGFDVAVREGPKPWRP